MQGRTHTVRALDYELIGKFSGRSHKIPRPVFSFWFLATGMLSGFQIVKL